MAGLIAETGRTLRQSEFAALAELAREPKETLDAELLTVARFLTGGDRLVREGLLARFGIFGIRLSTSLLRQGSNSAAALAGELIARSGLAELERVLHTQFAERRDLWRGSLRRRRRPAGLHEAGRVGRGRGRDVRLSRPPLPRDHLMGFDELRAIALFDGLGDDRLTELMAGGEESVVRRRGGALPRGTAGRSVVGPARGVHHLGAPGRPRGDGARRDVVTGSVGGGFRAWDEHGVYLATGRASRTAASCGVPAERLRECADAWFPFGVHFIQGLVEHRARHRVRGPPAGGAGRARHARRRVSRTRSTTRHRRRPARPDALDGHVRRAAVLARAAGPGADLGGPVRARSTRCAAGSSRRLRRWTRSRSRPGRMRCPTGSPATASNGTWLIAPPFAAAGLDIGWCERAAELLGRRSRWRPA